MFLNYFTIAARHLMKSRVFSAINLFGLTVGFLCFTILSLYVYDELSFDMFHHDAERIYRLTYHETTQDGTDRDVVAVAGKIGPESMVQIPEVEDAVRLNVFGRITMGNDPVGRGYEVTYTADADFFKVFNFPLVEGNVETALTQPDGVVFSESQAKKYFGEGPYLGKRIWSSMERDGQPVHFIVTGIFKDLPKNSHLSFNTLFGQESWRTVLPKAHEFVSRDWTSNGFVTYLKLKPNADHASTAEKITAMTKANYPPGTEFRASFALQPLGDIHMYSSHFQGSSGQANGIKPYYVYMFSVVAVLVLLIACLNYMNLSTAAAFRRVREIGTRKALGAMRSQLILQFTGEAIILSVAAMILALAILQVLLPSINEFTEKDLALGLLPLLWRVGLFAIILTSGLLSALYPAFIIAKVSAVEAFKRNILPGRGGIPMRKVLVGGQFMISVLMIACTLVIYEQVDYLQTKDIGFEKDNLIVIDINSRQLRNNFEQVKAQFSSIPEVVSITASTRVPGEWKTFPFASVKTDGSSTQPEMIFVGIDNDFLATYQIKLLAGRNFAPGESDSTKVILTESGARELGLVNPIGTRLSIPAVRWGGSIESLDRPFEVEVIGIAADFHFESFRSKLTPVIFGAPNTPIQAIDYYTARLETRNLAGVVEKLKAINAQVDPANPLEYTFLDSDVFDRFYRADEKRGQVFLAFSAVIVCIASLGLFALVSYAIESRTKEFGVRKVLGATVTNIVTLVSREFLLLVVVAGAIAVPLAWYFMAGWLNDFEYRVTMGIDVFSIAIGISLLIAFGTISVRAIRAGRANPAQSLRSE